MSMTVTEALDWLAATLAALLGALPLMLGTGVGSELRHPLGVTLVGGLIVSQLLTLFTTPVIYLTFEGWVERWRVKRGLPPVKLSHPEQAEEERRLGEAP